MCIELHSDFSHPGGGHLSAIAINYLRGIYFGNRYAQPRSVVCEPASSFRKACETANRSEDTLLPKTLATPRKETMRRAVLLAVLTPVLGVTAAVAATLSCGSRLCIGEAAKAEIVAPQPMLAQATPVREGSVTVATAVLVPKTNPNIVDFTGGTVSVAGGGSSLFQGAFSSSRVLLLSDAGWNSSSVIANGLAFRSQLDNPQLNTDDILVTPEPSTLGLLGTGLIALAGIIRRKIRR